MREILSIRYSSNWMSAQQDYFKTWLPIQVQIANKHIRKSDQRFWLD